jgi:outer membrane protein TolC
MKRFDALLAGLAGPVMMALAAEAAAQTLSFAEAVRVAETQSPRIAAQRHALSAAGEQVGRATELPDPKLRVGIENLPITGPDRFRYDKDSMTMRALGFMQEFPNSAKRAARGDRAVRLRGLEQANLTMQGALLRRDAAVAWLDVHYAERARVAFERLAGQFRLQIESVAAGVARGKQQAVESYAIRQTLEQANDRVIDAERAVAKARAQLAAWVGDEAKKPLSDPPDTTRLVHSRAALLERLAQYPQLRVYDEREALARAEVELARSSKGSDWSVEIGYGQRAPAFDNMLTVIFAFELPWQAESRQDRDVAARHSELEQMRAQREDARRMLEAEVRGWLADFDAAARRAERAAKVLAPLAVERIEAAFAAYRAGRGELAAVLEAERAATEVELGRIQAETERARAWAALAYLDAHGEGK